MGLIEIGERVGVFDSITDNEARLYGYGTYTGDVLIPEWEAIARQLLPLHQAAWHKVLEIDVNELIIESMHLLEAERQILADQGRDEEGREVNAQVAGDLVHRRRLELAERLTWDTEQALEWMETNERLLRSPRFEMDDGRVLWGNQTWWAQEKDARARIDDMRTAGVLITEV